MHHFPLAKEDQRPPSPKILTALGNDSPSRKQLRIGEHDFLRIFLFLIGDFLPFGAFPVQSLPTGGPKGEISSGKKFGQGVRKEKLRRLLRSFVLRQSQTTRENQMQKILLKS